MDPDQSKLRAACQRVANRNDAYQEAVRVRDELMLTVSESGWTRDQLVDVTGLSQPAITLCLRRARRTRAQAAA
jgi:hypothetical protein